MQDSPLYSNGPIVREPAQTGTGERYTPSGGPIGASPLRETVELLWRERWIILAAVVISVGAVAAYVFTRAPEYESSSLLSVQLFGNPALEKMGLGIEEELGMSIRTGSNELWKLRYSVEVAEYVAERLIAAQTVPETGERLSVLEDEDGNLLTLTQVAARLSGHVSFAQAETGVDAIRMTASSTVPGEAALIANLYAEAYINQTRESSRARIIASREFLEDQVQKTQSDLVLMEERIKNYMSAEGAAALDQEASQTVSQIAQLEAMRDEARIELSMQQASLASLEGELAEIEPRLVQRVASGVEAELERVQTSIADLELRVQQIYQVRPELRNNPNADTELVDLNGRIAQLRERADRLSRQYVDEMLSVGGVNPGEGGGLSFVAQKRRDMAEARIAISGQEAKITMLDKRLQEYEVKLRDIPGQSMQLAQLERAQQSTEQLYLFIVQKLQEFRIAEESELGYADVVRPAGIPGEPIRPKKARNLFLALVFGLMLGGGLVVAREHLDTQIHDPDDLRTLGYDVVGVIPDLRDFSREPGEQGQDPLLEPRSRVWRRFRKYLHLPEKDRRNIPEKVEIQGVKISSSVPMILRPMSPAAEAFRRLRTNIQFSRPDTVVETILVTSPEAGEGKSTTALNVAVAMAQAARRTVLIDADMRRPMQHRMLSVDRAPGLSELLFDRASFRVKEYATPFEDLYLIPAGSRVPNPSEALGSKRMRELLEKLRHDFDVIIIDTPPVLAFSDGILLSTQCDASLMVVEADRTDVRAFHNANELLRDVGATVIGGVLNKFDPRRRNALGYPYSYNYYHYRYYDYYTSDSRG